MLVGQDMLRSRANLFHRYSEKNWRVFSNFFTCGLAGYVYITVHVMYLDTLHVDTIVITDWELRFVYSVLCTYMYDVVVLKFIAAV